jgi:hypothetical protein
MRGMLLKILQVAQKLYRSDFGNMRASAKGRIAQRKA